MQKWEYKVTHDLRESELNKLGNEGWELVTIVAEVSGHADRTSSSVYAYFKRQLQ